MTLRRRVSIALVALVTIFVVAQGIVSYRSLEEQEDRLADELLRAETVRLADYARSGRLDGPGAADVLDRGGGLEAWLLRPDGSALPAALPDALADVPDGPSRRRVDGRELHLRAEATPAGRLVVIYDASDNERQVEEFGRYVIGLGLLCIGAAVVAARWLARVVSAPLERLTARLSEWVPDAARAERETDDEEARLLSAFGRVQTRFEGALGHEREFVAHLAHELRTPLAALRTDLELLDPSPGDAFRIRRMLASVDAAAQALDTARALSRRAAGPRTPVDLGRCVDDAWLTLGPVAASSELVFENRIPAGVTANVDRHALLTVLRNLLRNAAEHAAPAHCVVDGDATTLTIEDDGPGIPADELPFVFERSWRGARADRCSPAEAGDRGLGLAIVRQVTELQGWSLSVAARERGGVRFVLGFRPD